MITFTPIASSSKGNAYLVRSDVAGCKPLLLECGIPIKQLREKLPISITDIEACLLSHSHADHSRCVKDLMKAGIDIHTSEGTGRALNIRDHHRFEEIYQFKDRWAKIIFPLSGQHCSTVGWQCQPFEVIHDADKPLGFYITDQTDQLLFIPDTAYVTQRFADVNIIAVECNHIESILSSNIQSGEIDKTVGRRVRRNHMSLETLIDMLKANDLSKCRQVWLLHLSSRNSSEEIMRHVVQKNTGIPTYVAEDV